MVREALNDAGYVREISLEAVNRRGRKVAVRLVCSALTNPAGQVRGALLVMDATSA